MHALEDPGVHWGAQSQSLALLGTTKTGHNKRFVFLVLLATIAESVKQTHIFARKVFTAQHKLQLPLNLPALMEPSTTNLNNLNPKIVKRALRGIIALEKVWLPQLDNARLVFIVDMVVLSLDQFLSSHLATPAINIPGPICQETCALKDTIVSKEAQDQNLVPLEQSHPLVETPTSVTAHLAHLVWCAQHLAQWWRQ
jgi:hypothetical protein